tara:strand:+ start:111 stop:512 length:402 start_codon:yes stop_codon:yes gene_type:complete
MIHLCYKKYEWKADNRAHKSFTDKTGLDLYTVFGDYLKASFRMKDLNVIEEVQEFAHLHPRNIANHALHAIISSVNPDVEMMEIEDATIRVGWQLTNKPDDLSDAWPVVMYHTSIKINDYMNKNIPKKKETDI